MNAGFTQFAEAQRPEIGVLRVQPGREIQVNPDQYPWLGDEHRVPTVHVELVDGTAFHYGSLIGLNNTVAKIASTVVKPDAARAEESFFMALPFVLNGDTHPHVERVSYSRENTDLLKVGKVGRNASRLFFTVEFEPTPVVLRAGIAPHKDQMRLLPILAGKAGKSGRRKQDGFNNR